MPTAKSVAAPNAVGKLNGDANPDLAVANSSSHNVSVLLGNGAGAFGAARNFATDSYPTSVAIGRLNGDANPDLAVANFVPSNNVSVLLGNGAGSFGAATNFAVGGGPSSVAVGKLNGDANPDLAVANVYSDNVSVLLNTPSSRTLALSYLKKKHKFTGRLRSADPACIRGQKVGVLRGRSGPDQKVGIATSAPGGAYSITKNAKPGRYYAQVRASSACRAARSKTISVR